MPKAQAGVAVGDDGKIYIFGGVNGINQVSHEYLTASYTSYAYDPASNSWARLADMPRGARACAAVAGSDGLIYVFGGYNDSAGSLGDTQIYDPVADSWTNGAAMPFAVGFITAAQGRNGNFYVFGGNDGVGRVQIYNPVSDSWTSGTNMLQPRWSGSVVVFGSEMFYIGGSGSWGSASNVVMGYSYEYDSWYYYVNLPASVTAVSAAVGLDNLFYVVGGGNTAYNTGGLTGGQLFYNTTYVFNMYNGTWISGLPIPYNARYGMAAATDDGRIWFVGGNNNTVVYQRIQSLEVMRVTTTLDSTSVAQGGTLLVTINPQFMYLPAESFWLTAYLEGPTGTVFPEYSPEFPVNSAFSFEMTVPMNAPPGSYKLVVMDFYCLVRWNGVPLPDIEVPFTVTDGVPVGEQIAALQAEVAALQAALASSDANLTALAAQVSALQAQVAGLQAGLVAMGAEQSAAAAQLNATLADLQLQLDAFQEQINRVEDKADTAGTYGILTLILVVIVLVMLVLMFFMSRKKP